MRDYYKNLIRETEYRSTLIHDIKNHLYLIQSLATSENVTEINKYISNLLGSPALSQSLQRSDNELLNAILSRYAEECRRRKVSFDSDIRSNTTSFLSGEDMTTLFCNMLDNTLEAIEKIESPKDPFIDLIIEPRMDYSFTLIKLSNSYDGNELFIDSKGIIQTSKQKKENHGFGMKSMLSVINKYDGDINIDPNTTDKIFTITISLKRPIDQTDNQ